MAIDVAYLETSEFCAAHASAVESYQQRPPKQCPRRIDQARDFLQAQHRRQPTPVLGIGQEIVELMSLKCLDEKEPQGRYTINRGAGRPACAL